MITNNYWFPCTVPVILVRLEWNVNFRDRLQKKILKYSRENPSSGIRVVPCGRTDRPTGKHTHEEANSRFSQFCERAKRWQGQVKHLGQCFLLKSLWLLAWKDGKRVECMGMEMEAVMTPNKQVFKGMQKRQRNQISLLSSRNLQSPPPLCSVYRSIAPISFTPHSSVHQHNCSSVCWS